jgi:hypothetical protein
MTKQALNWEQIWDEIDSWYQERSKVLRRKTKCASCGHSTETDPEWDEQQKAIQRIVEKHIKGHDERE